MRTVPQDLQDGEPPVCGPRPPGGCAGPPPTPRRTAGEVPEPPSPLPQGSILKAHMVTHSSRKDHECKLCGASFRTKGSLIRHHRRHTGGPGGAWEPALWLLLWGGGAVRGATLPARGSLRPLCR